MKKIICACIALMLCACAFVSCSEEKEYVRLDTVNASEYTFELYGEGDVIRRIVVKKQENTRCVLDTRGKNFTFVDLNFDGYSDIRLDNDKQSGRYVCFIFQPTVESFTLSSVLGELREPVWDYEEKTVTSKIRIVEKADTAQELEKTEYKETRATAVWQFIGGQPVQISEVGVEYYSDSHMYCSYESRYIDGVLIRDGAADKWYFGLDELESDGYTW